MHIVIGMCGAIWIGAGLLLWTAARFITHEIFACMLVSFGVAFLGIAAVIEAVSRPGPGSRNDASPSAAAAEVHGAAK
jgi:hypothetical protein